MSNSLTSVVLHPAAKDASGAYRLNWIAEVLQKDYPVQVEYDYNYTATHMDFANGPKLLDVQDDVDGKVIVLQRPLWRWMAELIEALQRKGAAVVVEVDDNFNKIAMKHPMFKDVSPFEKPVEKSYMWLNRCCELADLVTVTTQGLADQYAKHGRYVILPNYAPRWYLDVPRGKRDIPWVGWTGTVESHIGDLQSTKGGVANALKKHGGQLHCVGTGKGVCEALQMDRGTATGFVPIEEYPLRYAELDIAIVPLRITPFNHSKSWLKMLEASALGVPVVGSPTEPNMRLHEMGIGTLAESSEEWYEEVSRLISDKQLRLKSGNEAREIVAEHLVLEDNAHKWWAAWEQAFVNRNERLSVNQLVSAG